MRTIRRCWVCCSWARRLLRVPAEDAGTRSPTCRRSFSMFVKRRSTRAIARPVRRRTSSRRSSQRPRRRSSGGRSSACVRRHPEHRPLHHPERAAHRREPAQELRCRGTLKSEPEQRWTVTVEAQLEILDESGSRLDGYTAKVPASDLPEGLTEDERDRFWYDLLSATMSDFDRKWRPGSANTPLNGCADATHLS